MPVLHHEWGESLLNELSQEQFQATVREPLLEVTRVPEAALDVDIWPYAEAALAHHYPEQDTEAWDVARVYVGADNAWQHVFIRTDRKRLFLVIVLDVEQATVTGHHLLDLDASPPDTTIEA